MRDIVYPLRVAYATALTQIPGMGVYYQSAPNNAPSDNYIVFRSINSVDASGKNASRLTTNITIEIHTRSGLNNTGLNADFIADQVFQLCYPDKRSTLSLTRGEILWTQIANDLITDYQNIGQFGYISRLITFRHGIFVDVEGLDGGGGQLPMAQGQLFRLEYTTIGGESGFTDPNLVNRRILAVFVDGIEYSPIITTGSPVDKQVLYVSGSGALSFPREFDADVEIAVLYQLNNAFDTLTFDYEATGGETTITIPQLANKNVYAVLRDGVSASQILFTGTPVDKQVLYTQADGSFTFTIALEPETTVKIFYQL